MHVLDQLIFIYFVNYSSKDNYSYNNFSSTKYFFVKHLNPSCRALYMYIYIFFCESTSQTRYGEDFLGKKTVVLVAMHCPSSEKHQRRSSSRMRVAAVPILPRKDGSNKGGVRAQITRAFFHEPRKSDISKASGTQTLRESRSAKISRFQHIKKKMFSSAFYSRATTS